MNIREMIIRLNTLPKGYISKKKIKGRYYYYYQYEYINKLISKYIKSYELEEYKSKIKERKQLEKQIKCYKRQKPFTISVSANRLTGYLMSEDKTIAKFKNAKLVKFINKTLAPIYITRTKDIESYLENRTIDLTRPNARVLLKQLGILSSDKYISLYSYGACIQDHYWFKPLHSKKTFKDIYFNNDLYSDIALEGKVLQFNKVGSTSPELTNIGSYEKCWRLVNNKWYLYKKGKDNEIYAEYFVYLLASNLHMNIAKYELDDSYIRSINFADKYNFEPMFSFVGDNDDYLKVFNCLLSINKQIAIDYLKLLWFDTIVYNIDRHNQNYGILRDRHTGKIISLAPNFDNNMALYGYFNGVSNTSLEVESIKPLIKFINSNKEVKDLFNKIQLPIINEEILDKTLSKCPNREDKDNIKKFILDRYKYLLVKLK